MNALLLAQESGNVRLIATIVWLVVLVGLLIAFAVIFVIVIRRMRKGQENAARVIELLESMDSRLAELVSQRDRDRQ